MVLSELETAVLEKLLSGEHPVLRILRQQMNRAVLARRTLSGAGFYAELSVPPDAPRLSNGGDFSLGDVDANIDGLRYGAGFVLFVKDGYLSALEGYSYGEPWPEEIRAFNLEYEAVDRDLSALDGRNAS
jgi:hypothetical protein